VRDQDYDDWDKNSYRDRDHYRDHYRDQDYLSTRVVGVRTSVQAAAQEGPPADASWEVGRRPGDLSAGPAALGLSPAAVAEL